MSEHDVQELVDLVNQIELLMCSVDPDDEANSMETLNEGKFECQSLSSYLQQPR
jgi:hypothetical protein